MNTKRTLLAGLLFTAVTAFAGPESWKAPASKKSGQSCCAPGEACCVQKLACCAPGHPAAPAVNGCCAVSPKGKSCCAR